MEVTPLGAHPRLNEFYLECPIIFKDAAGDRRNYNNFFFSIMKPIPSGFMAVFDPSSSYQKFSLVRDFGLQFCVQASFGHYNCTVAQTAVIPAEAIAAILDMRGGGQGPYDKPGEYNITQDGEVTILKTRGYSPIAPPGNEFLVEFTVRFVGHKNRVCVSQVFLKVGSADAAFMANMLHMFKRQNVDGGSCHDE